MAVGGRRGRPWREADIRKGALLIFSSLLLAGCGEATTYSSLTLPMEPTQDSVAARRRPLTEDEKQLVSDAVTAKVKGRAPEDFIWAPLVLRAQDGAFDYCGLVRGSDMEVDYAGYSKYLSRITLGRNGKMTKVEVVSMIKNKEDHLPTALDSRCAQDGYGGLPATK